MEKNENGNDNGIQKGKLTLEEELARASLTIQEEAEPEKDLDDGYYLDEDFDDSMFEHEMDFREEDYDLDDEIPYRRQEEEKAPPPERKEAAAALSSAVESDEIRQMAERKRSRAKKPAEQKQHGEREAVPPAGKHLAEQELKMESGQMQTPKPKPNRKAKDPEDTEETPASGGKGRMAAGITAAVLLLAAAGVYVVKAQSYQDAFYPNTVINGLEVSGMTVEQVKAQMASALDGYEIRLVERYEKEHVISGEEIGLHTVFDGSMEQLIEEQNPYLWPAAYLKGKDSQIEAAVAYEEEKFQACLDGLEIFDSQYVIPFREACLSDYIPGQGYEILPEEPGTQVNREKFSQALAEAVRTLQPQLSLEEAGCYVRSQEAEPDAALVELKDAMNRYATMTVTYTFGSNQEILSGEEIHQWLSFDENLAVTVDETKVSDYVSKLAKKYNTAYSTRKFKTSYGSEVDVTGFYGWQINQKAEAEALAGIIASGESQTREPEYTQKAASYEGNDYGDTYAEVNLTAQHMFLYKDGEKILESDFVSGNVSRGYTTPPGIFSLTYKQRDAVLKGQGYASPVKFWMPFNRGIGFHDASWRNTFGGSIYKTNGSHGCINMPYAAAKTLFENVYTGMPVICYNLAGTESKKSTSASGSGGAAAKPAQTQPAVQPTEPAAAALPTEAAAAQPSETNPAEQPTAATSAADLSAGPGGSAAVTNPVNPAGPGAASSGSQGTEYGPGGQIPQTQAPVPETTAPAPAAAAPLPAETPAAAPSGNAAAPSGNPAPVQDYSAGPGGGAVAPGSTAGPGGA